MGYRLKRGSSNASHRFSPPLEHQVPRIQSKIKKENSHGNVKKPINVNKPPHRVMKQNKLPNAPDRRQLKPPVVKVNVSDVLREENDEEEFIISGGDGFEDMSEDDNVEEQLTDDETVEINKNEGGDKIYDSDGAIDLHSVGQLFLSCIQPEDFSYQRKRLITIVPKKPKFSAEKIVKSYEKLDDASKLLASSFIGLTEMLNRFFLKPAAQTLEGFAKLSKSVAKFECPQQFNFPTTCNHQNGIVIDLSLVAFNFSRRNCKLSTIISSFVKESLSQLIDDYSNLTGSYASSHGYDLFPRHSVMIISEILTTSLFVDEKNIGDLGYQSQLADSVADYIDGAIKRKRVKALAEKKQAEKEAEQRS